MIYIFSLTTRKHNTTQQKKNRMTTINNERTLELFDTLKSIDNNWILDDNEEELKMDFTTIEDYNDFLVNTKRMKFLKEYLTQVNKMFYKIDLDCSL